MAEISIIVPVYNVEKYIRRCIDSLLTQTFKSIEILLIDDGSKDSSGAICDEYALKDDRVKAIHKKNGGVSSARNVGLDNATGTYIMFCDPDDYVDPTWCEKMYDAVTIEECKVFFGICGFKRVEADSGNVISIVNPVCHNSKTCVPLSEALRLIYKRSLFIPVWGSIFLKELIQEKNIRFKEHLSRSEDILFVLQYLEVNEGKVAFSYSPLYNYSTGISTSLTHKVQPNFWEIELNWLNKLKTLTGKNNIPHSAYLERYRAHIIDSALVSINMTISSQAPISQVFKRGNEIIHSPECRDAFKYGTFKDVNPIYKVVLRTRCFTLIWIFNQLVILKKKLLR